MRVLLFCLSFLFLISGETLKADVIVSPNSQYFNNFRSLSSGFNLNNLVNNSGFVNSNPFESGVTNYDVALTEQHRADLGVAGIENDAFGARFPLIGSTLAPGSIRLDLGQSYDLTGVAIWNVGDSRFPSSASSAMQDFRLRVSDDSTFAIAEQVTFANNSITETATEFTPTAQNPTTSGENFDFASTYTGRYVELRIFNSHALNDTVFVGEIAFSAIPEPGGFALALLLASGFFRRRRS